MPRRPKSNARGSRPLVDFQARFVDEFIKPGSPRHQRLVSPVGAGKQFTTVRLVDRLFSQGARHVLVLCPAALVSSWRQQLGDALEERGALAIDRQLFLELQSQAQTARFLWPERAIVISVDTAKSRAAFEKWLEKAHPASGDLRRPMHLKRPNRPVDEAYKF